MARKIVRIAAVAAIGVGAAASGSIGLAGPASASTPVSLVLPQNTAFGVLGHSCGGIQEVNYATGFDPTSGYPDGVTQLSTTCGGSGRDGGGHSTTYTAWTSESWDFTGVLITASALSSSPTVDPTLSVFDANGNQLYNASNSAFLVLSPSFVPRPRVTAISATLGPASGGTSVTITGTGFSGTTAVDFGTTAATSFTVASDNSITAVSPVASPGTVDITVTSAGGTDATSSVDQFTFYGQPVVGLVSPNSGWVTGGTSVVITGQYFLGASSVLFGDQPAAFSVVNDNEIMAVSPAETAPDSTNIVVTTPGGTSAVTSKGVFTYVAVPPPSTVLLVPHNGAVVHGTTVLDASASSSVGVASVQFELTGGAYAGTVVGTATPSIYGWLAQWNTATVPNGTYTLASVVTDFATDVTVSPSISISVANSVPTTSILVPSSGAALKGTTVLDASASSSVGVGSVQFELTGGAYAGTVVGTATPSIYGWLTKWNTATVPDGTYTLTSVVTDTDGISAISAGVTVTVANPLPTTGILVPSSGAALNGTTVLDASASSSLGVASVQFELSGGTYADTVVGMASPTLFGWVLQWNSAGVPNGSYTLNSVVTDRAGNTTASASVAVTVAN